MSSKRWQQAVALNHRTQISSPQSCLGGSRDQICVVCCTRRKFSNEEILGACEEVQLREQDFGNFQVPQEKTREMAERMEFGRFFYRFPNGESGADVYDRITIFEDHFVRDINAGMHWTSAAAVAHADWGWGIYISVGRAARDVSCCACVLLDIDGDYVVV